MKYGFLVILSVSLALRQGDRESLLFALLDEIIGICALGIQFHVVDFRANTPYFFRGFATPPKEPASRPWYAQRDAFITNWLPSPHTPVFWQAR